MSFFIPTEPNHWTEFNFDLDGQTVQITIKWNATDAAYYMDLYGITFDLDLRGVKLVAGLNLLDPYAITELGAIGIVDMETNSTDPTFDDLGTRYKLVYYELSEI